MSKAQAGDIVYDDSGTQWEVYLQEIQVPCVRLFKNGPNGERIYRDVPVSEYDVFPNYPALDTR